MRITNNKKFNAYLLELLKLASLLEQSFIICLFLTS